MQNTSSYFLVNILFLLAQSLQKQPPEMFYEKKVLLVISQNSQENTCARLSFSSNFIKKETLA